MTSLNSRAYYPDGNQVTMTNRSAFIWSTNPGPTEESAGVSVIHVQTTIERVDDADHSSITKSVSCLHYRLTPRNSE